MNRTLFRIVPAALIVLLFVTAAPCAAQVDFQGQWAAINQQDQMNRGQGPDIADFTGLPLNDAGRTVGLSYTSAIMGTLEP